jgi:hypothetical protein
MAAFPITNAGEQGEAGVAHFGKPLLEQPRHQLRVG